MSDLNTALSNQASTWRSQAIDARRRAAQARATAERMAGSAVSYQDMGRQPQIDPGAELAKPYLADAARLESDAEWLERRADRASAGILLVDVTNPARMNGGDPIESALKNRYLAEGRALEIAGR